MRKRIVAFAMAVVVAFGCVGYRPPKAYAAEIVMTAEALEMLYTLLLSMGVVVGSGLTHDEKISQTEAFYNSLPTGGKVAFNSIITSAVLVDGVYRWVDGLNDISLKNFWLDMVDGINANAVFTPAVDGLEPFTVDFAKGGSPSSYKWSYKWTFYTRDMFYFVLTDSIVNDKAYVFRSDGNKKIFMYRYRVSTGALLESKIINCASDSVVDVWIDAKNQYNAGDYWNVFTPRINVDGVQILDYASISYKAVSDYVSSGIAFGAEDKGYIWSIPLISFLTASYGAIPIDDVGLIDCDTWADTMSNVHETDKEVGIYTGKDLSGYNTSESAYEDLITGVKNPALNPDIPVTPDLTGISGVLGKILSALKTLASAIAIAVVGTGTLDFSKFNNIKLSGLFPFCIPFDLINVFKSFNGVQPIEPKWTIDLAGTPLKAGGKIELDLTQFGVWISIIRYFCYASFVVGLIVITRKVIKG